MRIRTDVQEEIEVMKDFTIRRVTDPKEGPITELAAILNEVLRAGMSAGTKDL